MISVHMIKDLAAGIISLLLSYFAISIISESFEYFASGEGMTVGIIGIWAASFLTLKYTVLR